MPAPAKKPGCTITGIAVWRLNWGGLWGGIPFHIVPMNSAFLHTWAVTPYDTWIQTVTSSFPSRRAGRRDTVVIAAQRDGQYATRTERRCHHGAVGPTNLHAMHSMKHA